MNVTVRLYAGLPDKVGDRLGTDPCRAGVPLTLEVTDGASVSSVLAALHLGKTEVLTMFVNGRADGPERMLREGDQIGLFPPIGGG